MSQHDAGYTAESLGPSRHRLPVSTSGANQRRPRPLSSLRPTRHAGLERVRITLRPAPGATSGDAVQVETRIGSQLYASETVPTRPPGLREGQAIFRQGFRTSLRRDRATAERTTLDTALLGLGCALRQLCLPGTSAAALQDLVDTSPSARSST